LKGLKKLKQLSVTETRSAFGIGKSAGATNLKKLILANRLCDDAVIYISKLSNLQWLNLADTEISESGMEKLTRALPRNARIIEEIEMNSMILFSPALVREVYLFLVPCSPGNLPEH